jgi:hypothetical protein
VQSRNININILYIRSNIASVVFAFDAFLLALVQFSLLRAVIFKSKAHLKHFAQQIEFTFSRPLTTN